MAGRVTILSPLWQIFRIAMLFAAWPEEQSTAPVPPSSAESFAPLNAKKYRLTISAFLDELITRSMLHIDEDYGKFCAIVGELKETAKYLDDYGYDTEFILHNLMTD